MVLLQRSDPIPKLLPQVRFGRMAKDAPGLQAVVSSWLQTYTDALNEGGAILDLGSLLRLDPNPRMAVLIEAGVLIDDDPAALAVRAAYAAAHHAALERDRTDSPPTGL